LLVIILGVMVQLLLAIYKVAELSPYKNRVAYTSGLPPFGQVNYYTADAIAFLEWLAVLGLWILFAVLLLREKSE